MSLLPGDVDTPLMSAFAPFAPPEAVASRESEVNIFERMRRESDIETSAANASSDDGLLPPHPRLLREKTADRVRTVPVDLLRVATGGYQAKRVERHATVEALIKEVATLWDLNPDGLDLRYHGRVIPGGVSMGEFYDTHYNGSHSTADRLAFLVEVYAEEDGELVQPPVVLDEPLMTVREEAAGELGEEEEEVEVEQAQEQEPEVTGQHDDDVVFYNEDDEHSQPESEVEPEPKPFLGGYRDKRTGVEYHHADAQTAPSEAERERAQLKSRERAERETQTVAVKTVSQQTARESGTQMDRRDLYLDGGGDMEVQSGQYQTSEELAAIQHEQAINIQSFVRQCFALRRVHALHMEREAAARRAAEKQQAEEQAQAEEAQRELERRMHPRTKQDFDTLYAELDAWREFETERIKAQLQPVPVEDPETGAVWMTPTATEEEVHAQLEELLLKEVRLLQTIDRLKLEAAKENRTAKVDETLQLMMAPERWYSRPPTAQADEATPVNVETPSKTRARELVELYHGLGLKDTTRNERLDILFHVRWTVREFDCQLTRDIDELVEREVDMLNRGRPARSLKGLRKRLRTMFLQFIRTPEFNPEAADFAKTTTPLPNTVALNPEGHRVWSRTNSRPVSGASMMSSSRRSARRT